MSGRTRDGTAEPILQGPSSQARTGDRENIIFSVIADRSKQD